MLLLSLVAIVMNLSDIMSSNMKVTIKETMPPIKVLELGSSLVKLSYGTCPYISLPLMHFDNLLFIVLYII